jgi:hypothetical protein
MNGPGFQAGVYEFAVKNRRRHYLVFENMRHSCAENRNSILKFLKAISMSNILTRIIH